MWTRFFKGIECLYIFGHLITHAFPDLKKKKKNTFSAPFLHFDLFPLLEIGERTPWLCRVRPTVGPVVGGNQWSPLCSWPPHRGCTFPFERGRYRRRCHTCYLILAGRWVSEEMKCTSACCQKMKKKKKHQRPGSRLPSARKRGARLGLQVILKIYPPSWSVETSAAHSTFSWKTSVVQTYFLTWQHAWAELSQRSWQQILLQMHSVEPVVDTCD